jgi:hypothetical protein
MKEWAYPKLKEEYCTLPNTGDQQHRECHLTKMQTFDLMTEMVRNIDDREKLIYNTECRSTNNTRTP